MIRPAMALAPDYPIRQAVPRRLATGAEAVLNAIRVRLATIRGSWGEDRLLGLPWVAWSLPPPDVEVQAQVRRQVAAVEGVLEIREVAVSFSGGVLQIAIRVVVQGDTGPVLAVVGDLGIWEGYAPGVWLQILQIGPLPIVRAAT